MAARAGARCSTTRSQCRRSLLGRGSRCRERCRNASAAGASPVARQARGRRWSRSLAELDCHTAPRARGIPARSHCADACRCATPLARPVVSAIRTARQGVRSPTAATAGCRMQPRHVHLVGSVPLADRHRVFETVERGAWTAPQAHSRRRDRQAQRLDRLARDGLCQQSGVGEVRRGVPPACHRAAADPLPAQGRPFGRRRHVRQSVLCRHRDRSYGEFARLKREGKIPPACRFQVDLVPAHSVIWLFLQDDLHAPLDPIYNAALEREIDKIAAAHPARSTCDPVRRGLGGVRAAASATSVSAMAATKDEMQATFGAHPDRPCEPCAGGRSS